jgi:hypothetical protein
MFFKTLRWHVSRFALDCCGQRLAPLPAAWTLAHSADGRQTSLQALTPTLLFQLLSTSCFAPAGC